MADQPPFKEHSVKGFTPYFYVWRLFGIWVMPDDWRLYKFYSVLIQFTCLVLFNLWMLLSLPAARNLDDIMDVLLPMTTTMTISLKVRLIVLNRESLLQLLATARQLEATTQGNAAEQAILRKSNRMARKLMISMTIGCFVAICGRFVQTVVSDQRKLMWTSWMPFDWEHATSDWPRRYAIGFQFACNFYIGVVYSTVDPLAPYLCRMLVANLEILANRLKALGNEVDSKERPSETRRKLIACVDYHRLCLQ